MKLHYKAHGAVRTCRIIANVTDGRWGGLSLDGTGNAFPSLQDMLVKRKRIDTKMSLSCCHFKYIP